MKPPRLGKSFILAPLLMLVLVAGCSGLGRRSIPATTLAEVAPVSFTPTGLPIVTPVLSELPATSAADSPTAIVHPVLIPTTEVVSKANSGSLSTPTIVPTVAAAVSETPTTVALTRVLHGDFSAVSFASTTGGCVGGIGVIVCTADGGKTWNNTYAGSLDIEQLQLVGPTTPAVNATGWAVTIRKMVA